MALSADPLLSADPTALGRAALPPPRTPEAASAGEALLGGANSMAAAGWRPLTVPLQCLLSSGSVHCDEHAAADAPDPLLRRCRQAAGAGCVPEQQDHAAARGACCWRQGASSSGPECSQAGPQPAPQGQRRAALPGATRPVHHSRSSGWPEGRRNNQPGQVPGAAPRTADPQPQQHPGGRRRRRAAGISHVADEQHRQQHRQPAFACL